MTDASRLFALTCDIDWASEDSIKDFVDFAAANGIKPTLFATHQSAAVTVAGETGTAEIGLHPNFLPGSTHGTDINSIIDHVCGLYPDAKCFRSHSFMDGTPVTEAFRARGFSYDSNLLTYFDYGLKPIRHASGIMRFPVFWEDDVHWSQARSTWDVDAYYDRFLSPGLKIINLHPTNFALNMPNQEFYRRIKGMQKPFRDLTAEDIEQLRHKGAGIRTFVSELFHRLRQDGIEFHTLYDLYRKFHLQMEFGSSDDAGRSETVSAEQHRSYWENDDKAKQKALQGLYGKRNAIDPYATSRDYNMRALEISAIGKVLRDEPTGQLVDFGCGNGYTLISLATNISGWRLEGVDFSAELIKGANTLSGRVENPRNELRFVYADAITNIATIADGSVDAVLTERFLLNLPSPAAQRQFIREIARVLRRGGLFLMCEGSMEGFRGLNMLRKSIGLDEIAETGPDNLSAIRFEDREIEQFLDSAGFDLIHKDGFSYFFSISRALHPALVSPERPKFKARINDLARSLQMNLPFTPGIGTNVLWTTRKR